MGLHHGGQRLVVDADGQGGGVSAQQRVGPVQELGRQVDARVVAPVSQQGVLQVHSGTRGGKEVRVRHRLDGDAKMKEIQPPVLSAVR